MTSLLGSKSPLLFSYKLLTNRAKLAVDLFMTEPKTKFPTRTARWNPPVSNAAFARLIIWF